MRMSVCVVWVWGAGVVVQLGSWAGAGGVEDGAMESSKAETLVACLLYWSSYVGPLAEDRLKPNRREASASRRNRNSASSQEHVAVVNSWPTAPPPHRDASVRAKWTCVHAAAGPAEVDTAATLAKHNAHGTLLLGANTVLRSMEM